jgi:hypothetical protein
MSFHTLRKDDFGLKIISELQIDLFFKENTALYSLEATSVGTMWSVVDALTNAIKTVSNNQTTDHDETGHYDFGNYVWADFYKRYIATPDFTGSGLVSTTSALIIPKPKSTQGDVRGKGMFCNTTNLR